MRCLVTGATGFIGSHLVHKLIGQDCEVAVLARPSSNFWRIADVVNRLKIITGDLAEVNRCSPAVQSFSPEVVFHLAWSGVQGAQRNDLTQIECNLLGSLSLLQAVTASGCACWVGLGSQAEYGHPNNILSEDSPVQPETLYGAAKLSVGLLAQAMSSNLSSIRIAWLRLFASFGPMDEPTYLIPYVIRTLLKGDKPALTQGDQFWDYLYVQDVVDAISVVATNEKARGIYNLGSGQPRTIKTIVERVRDLIDPELPLGMGDKLYGPNPIMHLQADTRRLEAATGWKPQVSIEDGLRKTIEWYRRNTA